MLCRVVGGIREAIALSVCGLVAAWIVLVAIRSAQGMSLEGPSSFTPVGEHAGVAWVSSLSWTASPVLVVLAWFVLATILWLAWCVVQGRFRRCE